MNIPRRRSPFLPSPLRPLRGRNNAYTLIELVAALSLMVVILGILMTILNSATNLWGSSRNQKKDLTAIATSITDLIADDLYQAVTDNSIPTNSTAEAPEYPSFILETPTNAAPNDVVVLLAFARRSSSRVPAPGPSSTGNTRLSLDAVFYTYYRYALFRHAIPLYNNLNDPQPLGTLLHELLDSVRDAGTHNNIITVLQDPTQSSNAKWQYSLLAEYAEPSLNALIPEQFVRKQDQGFPNMVEDSDKRPIIDDGTMKLMLPPIYNRLTADVLPDQIDVALHIFDEQDWERYISLLQKQLPENEFGFHASNLGTLISRRITLPQAGGSRLP